ncbi:hypothetical protein ISS85_04835 [Candidatus Microgenomates bacterium]|nr:hypothetical protein [Candidatus Microgenomates bacterium]
MAKLLRNQDRILLLLGAAIDLFEDLADAGGLMSYSYQTVYRWVPPRFRKRNVKESVKRSLKTGYIEKIFKNDQPYFRLTGKGKKKLTRDFPLLSFQKKKWDRKWRLVLFDIQETSRKVRDQLRRKLRELDFARFQQSVYITPHDFAEDMRDFLENHRLTENVCIVVTKELLTGDERVLASKLWRLGEINKQYKKILDFWEEEKEKISKEKMANEVKSRYLEILAIDPCLPRELLPLDWSRLKVEALLKRIST